MTNSDNVDNGERTAAAVELAEAYRAYERREGLKPGQSQSWPPASYTGAQRLKRALQRWERMRTTGDSTAPADTVTVTIQDLPPGRYTLPDGKHMYVYPDSDGTFAGVFFDV